MMSLRSTDAASLLPDLPIGLIAETPIGLPVTPLIRSGISTMACVPRPVTAS